MLSVDELLIMPELRIVDVAKGERGVIITARIMERGACCPACSIWSQRVHSEYIRAPQDLPIQEQYVRLKLHVRRFLCCNIACPRKTFVEQVPAFLARYARRTLRVTQRLINIALSSCCEGGARVSQREGIHTSGDTLLRILHQLGCPDYPTPEVLGIDDWAWRKGESYGTILCDLVEHRVVDILPDRETETLVAWLQTHPGVKIISRDRDSGYAKASRTGAPDAIQVADRWHLLKNLSEAVEQVLRQQRGALTLPIDSEQSTSTPAREVTTPPAAPTEVAPMTKRALGQLRSQEARYQLYIQTRALYDRGEDQPTIARLLGISLTTIRKYVQAEHFPASAPRPVGSKALQPFTTYLDQRWNEGCHVAKQLWREICAQGYDRSPHAVFIYVSHLRQGLPTYTVPKTTLPPTRRIQSWQAARLWTAFPDNLTPVEIKNLSHLRQVQPAFEQAYQLAQAFIKLLHNRQPKALLGWIRDALQSPLTPFKTLAMGLHRDRVAVLAALTLPWSNGQVEGQINRLKTLKRQMYGQSDLALLRIRLMRPI